MKQLARRLIPRALRNALRRPARTVSLLAQGLAWRLGHRATCELRAGWAFPCHPAAKRALLLHRDDAELRSELDSFTARCREGMVFFDVGAHYGVFSLAALHYGRDARVVAVEPSAEASSVLRANLGLAGAGERAKVVQAAVGAKDGTLRMLTTGPNAENYMVGTDEERPDVTEVRQRTLGSLAAETGLVPTHVKIDVEGFEGEVLEGGRELLARARPLVFLELHGDILRGRGRAPRAVLATLEELGYRRFTRDEQPAACDALAAAPIVRIVCETGEGDR